MQKDKYVAQGQGRFVFPVSLDEIVMFIKAENVVSLTIA